MLERLLSRLFPPKPRHVEASQKFDANVTRAYNVYGQGDDQQTRQDGRQTQSRPGCGVFRKTKFSA